MLGLLFCVIVLNVEHNMLSRFQHDHSLQINTGEVMNRLQVWKAISVVFLACGLASAQNITTFSAPGAGTGAGQGTGGFGINPQGTVVGSYLDDGNVFHGFQCVSRCAALDTFTTYDAPGAGAEANQGTITFSINLFGVIAGYYVDSGNVAHGFVTGKAPARALSPATSTWEERSPDTTLTRAAFSTVSSPPRPTAPSPRSIPRAP